MSACADTFGLNLSERLSRNWAYGLGVPGAFQVGDLVTIPAAPTLLQPGEHFYAIQRGTSRAIVLSP